MRWPCDSHMTFTLSLDVGLSMTYLIEPWIFSVQLASHVTWAEGREGGRVRGRGTKMMIIIPCYHVALPSNAVLVVVMAPLPPCTTICGSHR